MTTGLGCFNGTRAGQGFLGISRIGEINVICTACIFCFVCQYWGHVSACGGIYRIFSKRGAEQYGFFFCEIFKCRPCVFEQHIFRSRVVTSTW